MLPCFNLLDLLPSLHTSVNSPFPFISSLYSVYHFFHIRQLSFLLHFIFCSLLPLFHSISFVLTCCTLGSANPTILPIPLTQLQKLLDSLFPYTTHPILPSNLHFLLSYSVQGESIFLCNISNKLPSNTASYPKNCYVYQYEYQYTNDEQDLVHINIQDSTMGNCIPEEKRVYTMIHSLEYNLHMVTVIKNEIESHNFLHP
jgi:hypothetical protein